MAQELIPLPKKSTNKFLHPSSRDLILSLAGAGLVFTFWNSINIRPSLLTDPAYQAQKAGLETNMVLSMGVISAMSLVVPLIYGKNGYVPGIVMFLTGAGMYVWTAAQLNNLNTGDASSNPFPQPLLSSSIRGSQSVLFHPEGYNSQSDALPIKTRREHSLA